MNIEKIFAIVRKEIIEIFYSRNEVIALYVGSIIPSIILPIVVIYSIPFLEMILNFTIEKDPVSILQYFIDRIYPWFFIIGNVSVSISIITDSIMGEKERKTIERLLSTPIDELTLLFGKSIAAWLHTFIPTLLSFCTFLLFSNIFSYMILDKVYILPSIKVIFILLILSPIVTMQLIGMGTIISLKSKTVREANNLSGFISFIIVIPTMYAFYEDPDLLGLSIVSIIMGIISIIIFLIAGKLFKREDLIK